MIAQVLKMGKALLFQRIRNTEQAKALNLMSEHSSALYWYDKLKPKKMFLLKSFSFVLWCWRFSHVLCLFLCKVWNASPRAVSHSSLGHWLVLIQMLTFKHTFQHKAGLGSKFLKERSALQSPVAFPGLFYGLCYYQYSWLPLYACDPLCREQTSTLNI